MRLQNVYCLEGGNNFQKTDSYFIIFVSLGILRSVYLYCLNIFMSKMLLQRLSKYYAVLHSVLKHVTQIRACTVAWGRSLYSTLIVISCWARRETLTVTECYEDSGNRPCRCGVTWRLWSVGFGGVPHNINPWGWKKKHYPKRWNVASYWHSWSLGKTSSRSWLSGSYEVPYHMLL